MARKNIDDEDDIALHNGFGQSYDHEEADREAFREIAYVQGLKEGREKGMEEGREEGRQVGREEGREEGKNSKCIDIAKNLLKKKMNIEEIAEIVGLSVNEIKKI